MDKLDKQIVGLVVLIGLLGGLVNALDAGENCDKPLSYRYLIVQTFIGGFSGLMFGFVGCYILGENPYLLTIIAGSGGVLGMRGIRGLSNVVRKFIEFNIKTKK